MKRYTLFALVLLPFIICCNKQGLLDARSRTSLVIPGTLKDFQAILDNYSTMNVTPYMGELSADNYFMTTTYWQGRSIPDQNAYTWQPEIYNGSINVKDWNEPYIQVLYANTVLEGLAKLSDQSVAAKQIQGEALFFRAFAFHNLALVFAPTYEAATAETDMGIPLRLSADLNEKVQRASVKDTYERILEDLVQAAPLLAGVDVSNYRNRPGQRAAYALLARVYLSMRDYAKAGSYADSALQLDATLINYNTVSLSSAYYLPFTRLNAETIFQSTMSGFAAIFIQFAGISNQLSIDSTLFRSYHANDLRRNIFFYQQSNGSINVNGSYAGVGNSFTGLATDELFLIRAESHARAGRVTEAMKDLNMLLRNRYKTNAYTDLTAGSSSDALTKVLTERRKEMPLRGVRWSDIKRLNKEGANITLVHIVNNQAYTLSPNSPLYVLPIPPDAVQLGGLIQNQRP